MTKADLLDFEPTVIEDELLIIVTFAKVAKWVPKIIYSKTIELEQFLELADKALSQDNAPNITTDVFTVTHNKQTVKLTVDDTYFVFKRNQWMQVIQHEINNLYLRGYLSITKI